MPTPDARAVEQAIDWLVRLRFNQSDEATRQAFEQWLRLRPENARAWQRAASLGEEFSALPPELAHLTLEGSRRRMSRRQVLKTLGLCITAGSLAWVGSEHTAASRLLADHHSGTGERSDVELADGTRVRLNSNSAFDVSFNQERRLITLQDGALLIEPGNDAQNGFVRPFWVHTRNGGLLAHSRRFLVREENGATLLAVDQGQVTLLDPAAPVVIRHGQQAQLQAGAVQPLMPTGLDPWAWVDGVISANGTRLGDFLAELSHHRPGLLRCTDEVMALRVSGTYQLADTDQVLALLARTLPIRLHYRSRYWVTVTAKNA